MPAKQRKAPAKKTRARRSERIVGKVLVTYPSGRRARHEPGQRRDYPPGTMLQWDVETADGRVVGRWTVTGGGWPFDD
jgi:hypothetical protein